MKKFKIEFCSNECCGVKYMTAIEFGTLRSAKTVANTLKKEGYEVVLYKRVNAFAKIGVNAWEQIENAA